MSTIDKLRPETVIGIKRLADRLQGQSDITRAEALDAAARRGGFHNFANARRAIEEGDARTLAAASRSRQISRDHEAYREHARREWSETVDAVAGPALPDSRVWSDLDDMLDSLGPFMGTGRNHGFFPTGGGHDFSAVRPSVERGCIELAVGQLSYVARPRKLRLERIPLEVAESFLFLELAELAPPGVYEPEPNNDTSRFGRRRRESEELVDLGGADYVERGAWDRGFVDHEDDPLPKGSRLVMRLLNGNVMIACKASVWNRIPQTYSGLHDQMGADLVRHEIETGLERHRAKTAERKGSPADG